MQQLLLPESAENRNTEKAVLINQYIPTLDIEQTADYLGNIQPNNLDRIKIGSFASIAFDIVFSPGIIPKMSQPHYRAAYTDFFRKFHGLELFDADGRFVRQFEEDFYYNQNTGSSEDKFVADWVANLRSVYLLMQHRSGTSNLHNAFINNFVEAVLCRMAENQEEWPDDLIWDLPNAMGERLYDIRKLINAAIQNGEVLRPHQFFHIANEVEFSQRDYSRGNRHERASLIQEVIDEITSDTRSTMLPPLSFQPAKNWKEATPRQVRQINMSSLVRNFADVQKWVQVLLGTNRTGSVPPIFSQRASKMEE